MIVARTVGIMRICSLLVALHSAGARADDAAFVLGKTVFLEAAQPQCAACHTLADAKAAGEVGPVLDELKPDAARVTAAVTNGIGIMPAYEALTKEQIDAVALYVSMVAGKQR